MKKNKRNTNTAKPRHAKNKIKKSDDFENKKPAHTLNNKKSVIANKNNSSSTISGSHIESINLPENDLNEIEGEHTQNTKIIENEGKSNTTRGSHEKNIENTKKVISDLKKQDRQIELTRNKDKRIAKINKEKIKRKRNKKIAIITTSIACVYIIGIIVFSFLNYPRTYFSNTDISFKGKQNTINTLKQLSSDYSLTISGLDFNKIIYGNEISYKYDAEDVTNKILNSKNPFTWPIDIFLIHDFKNNFVVDFDKDKLNTIVTSAIQTHNQTAIPPVNAGFNIDMQTKTVSIKPEIIGNTINLDAALLKIDSCVGTAVTYLELTNNEQDLPTIVSTHPNIQNAINSAEKILQSNLDLYLAQTKIGNINFQNIAKWLIINENYNAQLDQNLLSVYISDLATNNNTVGTTRTFSTPYGKTCSVAGGDCGWIIDNNALINKINENIVSGTNIKIDIPCTSSMISFLGAGQKDWGARYIDVDLSEQHARMYNEAGSLVWESDIVTGKPGENTPTGVYSIKNKLSPTTLIGVPDPSTGEPSYRSDVEYWMPFVGNSIGLHDATWQTAFGGNRWQNFGSHGCVNLPLSNAAAIYGICNIGDIVVVHN